MFVTCLRLTCLFDFFLIFQDVQFGDIDYMIRMKDFTYDPVNFKGLPEFVRSIKKDGLRYIIILVSTLVVYVCSFFFCLNQLTRWNITLKNGLILSFLRTQLYLI